MDRGAWWAAVHGVAKSDRAEHTSTFLSSFHDKVTNIRLTIKIGYPHEDVSASRAGIFVTCIHPCISGTAPGTEEHQNDYCLSKDDPRRPSSLGSASGPLLPDAQLSQQGVLELLGSLRSGRISPLHAQRLKLHQIPSPAPPHHCLSA